MKIRWYKGLPGSGKSTDCKKWVSKDPTNRVRVSKDDLRLLLHGAHYSKGNEKQVLTIQNNIILDSLKRGKSVGVDNTHLVDKHLNNLRQLLKDNNLSQVEIEVIDLTKIEVTECVKRDLKRLNSVGADVIWRMYWDHIVGPIKLQEKIPNLPECIIVDIDGTLAEMDGRHPFEWDKVITDKCRTHIAQLIDYYAEGFDKDVEVILMSGRDSCCRAQTEQWLAKMQIGYNQLLMRPEGNMEKDTIIKERLYRENVEGNFNVALVVDDRPSVIRMWYRLGLPVVSANPIVREF